MPPRPAALVLAALVAACSPGTLTNRPDSSAPMPRTRPIAAYCDDGDVQRSFVACVAEAMRITGARSYAIAAPAIACNPDGTGCRLICTRFDDVPPDQCVRVSQEPGCVHSDRDTEPLLVVERADGTRAVVAALGSGPCSSDESDAAIFSLQQLVDLARGAAPGDGGAGPDGG